MKDVDVFYIYPTSYDPPVKNEPYTCAVDDQSMLAGSKIAFEVQATAFETVGNIYAPYYRQVDGAYATSSGSLGKQDEIVSGIPKADVVAAFDTYVKHYNRGRPYILASHSQGSVVARLLLAEYMKEHPDVYGRMIAAYVIGYSITTDYLSKNPHLKFAEGPDDTGVIISYNVEAPDFAGSSPLLGPGTLAINPISWTREETRATAEQSLGSRIDVDGKFVDRFNYADAQVDKNRGVVKCSVDPTTLPPSPHWPEGIYHRYDYGLFYYNLRENAARRTRNYLSRIGRETGGENQLK